MAKLNGVRKLKDKYKGREIEIYLHTPEGSTIGRGNFVDPEYLASVNGEDVTPYIHDCYDVDVAYKRLCQLIDEGKL
ncbi:hypothetical protein [Deinococcus irradiatisoli]|uniref:hypothetical protein n=1 Tax=Deinococcus irradiatisoli TaxID=2202254 RepID=UPI0011B22E80|nr:hypothetical protein [Deinococcus irradiatisoli]